MAAKPSTEKNMAASFLIGAKDKVGLGFCFFKVC